MAAPSCVFKTLIYAPKNISDLKAQKISGGAKRRHSSFGFMVLLVR
jgi:hypothetical protein